MKDRPTSITVIGWILIVFALIGALGMILSVIVLQNPAMQQALGRIPAPLPIQLTVGFVGIFIRLLCGIALLKGQNWARFLYVGWSVFAFVYGFSTASFAALMMVPHLVYFLVISVFLFTPKSRQYFSKP